MKRIRMAVPLLAALAFAPLATAQPFEEIYGPTATADSGALRTNHVAVCPGGGFISVGTQGTSTTNPNVYVVRTNQAGATIFERTYDIGPGRLDRAEAVAEAAGGSGFIVAGATISSATAEDAFLMKISCAGAVMWTMIYHSPLREGAFDVVEAMTGDAAFGTAPGDILVAGYAMNSSGTQDALLFRTKSNGTLVWNLRYDTGGQEFFRALTEARPTGATTAGDVVAAGSLLTQGTTSQGYVARVSGNTGQTSAAPHCFASWGGPDSENFNSVVELQTAPLSGQLALGGVTTSAAGGPDVYLARSTSNPCTPVVQRRIGAAAPSDETASSLREVLTGGLEAPVGSLAFTGRATTPSTTGVDAALNIVNPSSLVPLGVSSGLFGDHGPLRDEGLSLGIFPASGTLPPGFVIGGFSDSDFQGVGDTRDLYLIATTQAGRTSCSLPWNPPHVTIAFPVTAVNPTRAPFLQSVSQTVAVAGPNTRFVNCP